MKFSAKEFFYDTKFVDYLVENWYEDRSLDDGRFENRNARLRVLLRNEYRRRFVIPVNNATREEAEETLRRMIRKYRQNDTFPEVRYDIQINRTVDTHTDVWYPIRRRKISKFSKIKKFINRITRWIK